MLRFERMTWAWTALALLLAAGPAAASVYWIDTSFPSPVLGKADSDGMNPVTVPLAAGTLPEGLALEEGFGHLYWAEAAWSGAAIGRATVALGDLTGLVAGGSVFRDIDFDFPAGKLYWTSSNLITGSQLHRANFDGSGDEVLVNLGPAVNLRGVAVDRWGDRVYLADYDGGLIHVRDLAGALAGASIPAVGAWGVSWDDVGQRLYWTDYAGGRLMRTNVGTNTTVQILGALGNPTYLDIDPLAGKIYWVEAAAGAQRIMRANLDGTLSQNLGLPIGAYGGLAVGPDSPTPTLLVTLQADAVEGGIELRWQFADPGRFQSWRVERADGRDGPWVVIDAETREESGRIIALDRDVEAGRSYLYRLAVTAADGTQQTFGPISATAGVPITAFALASIAPNPTRGLARIDYAIPRASNVSLAVLDVQGRVVADLFDGTRESGRYQAVWSGEGRQGRVPAGLYFVLFRTPEGSFVRRVVMQN
jgi:DNA-binding beta-propeller fold protein YncE